MKHSEFNECPASFIQIRRTKAKKKAKANHKLYGSLYIMNGLDLFKSNSDFQIPVVASSYVSVLPLVSGDKIG